MAASVVSLVEDDSVDSDDDAFSDDDKDSYSSSVIVSQQPSSSTENIDSSTTSTSNSNDRVISLLDKLKRPTPTDIARRRKVKTNPPPTTKRRCRGSTSSSPKRIMPQQRMKEFGEPLTISNGYLFCRVCREQISTKLSVIKNHLHSTKHSGGKERLKRKEAKERNIVECLRKHNDSTHMRGETLPEDQQVYRV